jgi:hypothetical protein
MRRRRHMYIPRQESAIPYVGLSLSIVMVIVSILYFLKELLK